jgi:hypothetical protein
MERPVRGKVKWKDARWKGVKWIMFRWRGVR